jgi:polygalacturonase
VTGASGHEIDGGGARWWDGEGSNGGKTKPKFFQAHDLISSTISDIYILNPPVQVFSIDGCTDLTVTGVTIDGTAGNSLGANTDGFDIGDSTSVTISGANVYNQDDCVAVNSGTVSMPSPIHVSSLKSHRILRLLAASAQAAMDFLSVSIIVYDLRSPS